MLTVYADINIKSLRMTTVYLSIGTNIGDKKKQLEEAISRIGNQVGKIVSRSAFYVTEPWGFESKNTFLNGAVTAETELEADDVLKATQNIEKEMGRKEKSVNGAYKDRIIDIDILMYGNDIINTDRLTVPHKLMHERAFVLEPLAEIAPDVIIPKINISVKEALERLQAKLGTND